MNVLDFVIIGVFSCFVVYAGYLLSQKIIKWRNFQKSITPQQARNKNNERKLLEDLLDNLQANKNHWYLVEESISRMLVNDYKGIGIIYNSKDMLSILLNLDLLEKFDKLHEDTVKIQIQGDHAKYFIGAAEAIIDKRGNEINFFRDELGKRL